MADVRRGKRAALEIAKGLHYLHWRKLIHFDLKSGKQCQRKRVKHEHRGLPDPMNKHMLAC